MIRDLIAAGINVNVTLLFSPERYRPVARAYMDGPERRTPRGMALATVASVASFFLSRIDTAVDKRLDALAAPASRRRARCAARRRSPVPAAPTRSSRRSRATREWQALAARGARPQRLLWASTSTKDPTFSPVKYVEELVVPGTVNTMPLETLNTYRRRRPPGAAPGAPHRRGSDVREGFERLGVDLEAVAAAAGTRGCRQIHRAFRQTAAVAARRSAAARVPADASRGASRG